ncbi:hypothetical protein [Burkholderia sp. BCC1993]|uniref:hypothetical protein n=1 Tax=Burkholderia sp. BCC1993 TaxID=2817444 RepID=UPI002AB1B917|nr:hypothetical protein [Burkholderia sp. BCC1993]
MEQKNENENEYPPDNRQKADTHRLPAAQSTLKEMVEPRQVFLNEFLTKNEFDGPMIRHFPAPLCTIPHHRANPMSEGY